MKFLLPSNKKIYFASDLHLMMYDEGSRRREVDFIQWLDMVKIDAVAIFLLGDIFDFWFEYRHVVPRGFVRLLGKFAELTDSGVPIHFFTGNHDQWVRDYLSGELNIIIHRHPAEFNLNGKLFLIGHGHDVAPESSIYKILYPVFSNRFFRRLYAALHPYWGIAFGKNWSISNRKRYGLTKPFVNLERECIYQYIRKVLPEKHYDFFVFGHRHLAMDIRTDENSRYINTGEWIETQTYAVFDGKDVSVQKFRI